MVALILGVLLAVPVPREEMHVVSLYESSARANGLRVRVNAQVVVDRPGKDVTLFLSAYEPVSWQILVSPKTKLTKVILGGYHKQTAEVPKGVEVVEAFQEGREGRINKQYVSAYYNIDSGQFRSSAQAVRKFTGHELWSFQGSYNYDPLAPIVVDRVPREERLSADYPRLTPADELPRVTFWATRLVMGERDVVSALYGEFTQAGPQKKTLVGLPKGVRQVTYDPAAKRHYGITGQELHAVDLDKGTSQKIEPPAGVDPNWLRATTHDAKRGRVLVSGRNAMYEYTPGPKGGWAVLVPNNKGSFSALAWQAGTDTLYAIGNDEHAGQRDGGAYLFELTPRGAVAAVTPLGPPAFKGLLQGGLNDRAELIDLGSELAAVIYREGRDENGARGKPEAFLYIIDPLTGKVKLAWKE